MSPSKICVPEIVSHWEDHSTIPRRHPATLDDKRTSCDPAVKSPSEQQPICTDRQSFVPTARSLHHMPTESANTSSAGSDSTILASETRLDTSEPGSQPSNPVCYTELEVLKGKATHLKKQRLTLRQEMAAPKAQLKERLKTLLLDSRQEENRLSEEVEQLIQREAWLMDQIEMAQDARRRCLQAAEEQIESKKRERKPGIEYIMARSVIPGSQRSKRRSKRKKK